MDKGQGARVEVRLGMYNGAYSLSPSDSASFLVFLRF